MRPTMLFSPFGKQSPRVVLFGQNTGDWNMSRLQNSNQFDEGLYFRLSRLSGMFGFDKIYIPTPTECNTMIASPSDFVENINSGPRSLQVMRGVKADGMVLQSGSTGAIASADCPTIVAYCSVAKTVIVGHGGSRSLIDVHHVLDHKPPREHGSVVDVMVSTMASHGFRSPQIFVTCGIRGYMWPHLAAHIGPKYSKSAHGCIIDLKMLIAEQFAVHGINEVTMDTIDTKQDFEAGCYTWHSHRRGETETEKAARNLVLIVN